MTITLLSCITAKKQEDVVMKTLFLSLAFLLAACIQLPAQNYQTFYSNRTALFDVGNSNYQGMKIDSVKIQGNDSVFYPLKRIGRLNWECYTPYKASWTGEQIIISDGWNLFINTSDTLRIKTDAEIDDSWVAYSNHDYTIAATVTAHKLSSFLGVEDSVKTITFQAVDRDNTPIEHLWNNKTIRISKNYGLIRGFDFTVFSESEMDYYYFPGEYELAGLSNPVIGIQNFTWKEVWNFEPGDVIHVWERNSYYLWYCEENKKIITYLERNDDEDKITYKLSIRENNYLLMYGEVSTKYSNYETTQYIYEKETFDKLPGELIWEGEHHVVSNVLYSYNKLLFKGIGDLGISYSGEGSCWRIPVVDACTSSFYIKGLGGPYYECEIWGSYQRTLIYYKKGNTEWGTPLILSGINKINTQTPQVTYDKASDSFRIDFDLKTPACLFELIDLKGQILIQEKIASSPHSIPAGNFQRGLYLYRLKTEEKVYSGKIIK